MNTRSQPRSGLAGPLIVGLALVLAAVALAGDLEPPGPPGSTMKTLDQVEPRTPLGQSDLPITIFTPGSYYLTSNLEATGFGDDAVTISSSDVTLDLSGFAIKGSEVGIWDNGVTIETPSGNVVVKNGTVRDCNGFGVDLQGAENSRVENIRAEANTGTGIRVTGNSLIVNSNSKGNGDRGFQIDQGSTIVNSTARDNDGYGIYANSFGIIDGCVSRANGDVGIRASGSSIVRNSQSTLNTGDGMLISTSIVTGCAIANNTGHGIALGNDSTIRENNIRDNGQDGIEVAAFQSGNRLEANNLVRNGHWAIDVNGSDNTIVKNSADSNVGGNYDISAGNATGATVGNPISAGPWDNIAK